jgi:hypothetical protein
MNNITIQLPDDTNNTLRQRASANGEPPTTFASTLLRQALEEPNTTSQPAPTRQLRPTPKAPAGPPPWLPPTNDPDWYPEMWDAILALRQRYTAMLLRLERNWWLRADRAETLGALVTWRASIDAEAQDPREELAFHSALFHLKTIIDHTRSTVDIPPPDDSPPPEWCRRPNRR